MADISAVFISIDLYSSTLDRLIQKTDKAVDKLIDVSSNTQKAISDMNTASNTANQIADKLQKTTTGMNDMMNQMAGVGLLTVDITDNLVAAGNSALNAVKKIQGAADSIDKTTDKMNEASENTKKATDSLEKVGKAVDKVKGKIDKAKNSITEGLGKAFGKVFNLDNLKNGMKLIDNLARTNAKLGAVNDGNQTNDQLRSKIFAAAGHSRGTYTDMAGSVTKLESSTGNLFKTNDETIAFTELAQKSFVAGGGNKEERSSAMGKLTDSMAGGSLKGEDLQSLAQTAPAIMEAISSYTGSTGSDLKALADQGQITAEVIKNAMFASSDQINGSFANAPMTFEDIWTRIKDGGLQAFSGIMEQITNLITMPEFSGFINGLITGFGLLAEGVSWVIGIITEGWSTIGPILGIAAIAILGIMTAHVIAMAFSWIFAAMPILLIIGLIMGVIAIAMKLGVTWQEIIGAIGGVIGGFAALFFNIFVFIWNVIADFVNFFANCFVDPTNKVKILFLNLGISLLGIIENVLKGFEGLLKILGVNFDISSKVQDWKTTLEAKVDDATTQTGYKTYIENKDYKDLGESSLKGYNFAIEGADKIGKSLNSVTNPFGDDKGKGLAFDPFSEDKGKGLALDPFQATSPTNPLPIEGTGPNGSVNVEMPDDDLDYLRDIAERDYIANVATNSLAPNISIQFGDVHENADANKVAGRIREILQNEIAVASEGGY